MTLTEGYAATSTTVFTITGTAPVTITKMSGDNRITWNSTTMKLDIASGLSADIYSITLQVANRVSTTTFTFTLTVEAQAYILDIPASFVGGSISANAANSVKAGQTVTLTITPNAGFVLDKINVYRMDDNRNAVTSVVVPLSGAGLTRTFTMPAHHVTVTATFAGDVGIEPIPPPAALKAYARDGILFVSGLTAGDNWSVYSFSGILIYRSIAAGEEANISLPDRGIYIIQSGNRTAKIAVNY